MKGNVAQKTPTPVELVSGKTVYWCSCGLSQKQPFCDGSHMTTSLTPIAFTPEVSGTAYLCGCKQTNNPPLCDGSHQSLQA
jgi:CDGSH-type Zn-finger protein